jgi:hypothetical protein
MEITKEMLEKEVEKIEEEIDALYDKKSELYSKIREIEMAKYAITNNLLDIKVGTIVIALYRSWDYHCAFLRMFKITEADRQEFRFIETVYRTDDGDLSIHTGENNANTQVFHSMIDSFDLITVSEENYKKILLKCCELTMDYDEKDKFYNEIKSMAINRIVKGS